MTSPARVVIVAPYGADARVLGDLARRGALLPVTCRAEAATFDRTLGQGWDVLLLTAEACRPDLLDVASRHLAAGPVWSAPPVVLLAEDPAGARAAARHLRQARPDLPFSILVRPCEALEIASALGVAAEVRAGQQRVRDLLEDRRRAEEQANFLFHELSHRVGNLFAMIRSLVNQTARAAPEGPAFRAAFLERIDGLAEIYAALRDQDWQAADIDRVVRGAVTPLLAAGADADRVSIGGPSVGLTEGVAMPLGLALHELGNNARKYGALSVPSGRIHVAWTRAASGALRLGWTETGGPRVRPPTREGFGTIVIRSLADRVAGATVALAYPPEGLACTVTLPADALTSL